MPQVWHPDHDNCHLAPRVLGRAASRCVCTVVELLPAAFVLKSHAPPSADVWKGNTAYLGGCYDAMARYEDPHDPAVVHHGYCDPFQYPVDPADRINGWQLNMSTVPDVQGALSAYKASFVQALASIGAVNLPRAVRHKHEEDTGEERKKHYTYPDDYSCAIEEGDDMKGCCTETDNDVTWLEAQQQGWCVHLWTSHPCAKAMWFN